MRVLADRVESRAEALASARTLVREIGAGPEVSHTYTHAHTRTHTHTPILVKCKGVLNVCLHFNRMTFACVFNDIRGNMRRTVANYFLRFDVHCSLFVMSLTRMGVRWSSVTTKLICLMKMDKQL